jgi:hypothetical protein
LKIKVVVHEAEEGGYWAEVPAIAARAAHSGLGCRRMGAPLALIRSWRHAKICWRYRFANRRHLEDNVCAAREEYPEAEVCPCRSREHAK